MTHKQIESLIESNLLKTPAEAVFQCARTSSGIHMNMVTMPNDSAKKYIILSNADGKVDIIEKEAQTAYK